MTKTKKTKKPKKYNLAKTPIETLSPLLCPEGREKLSAYCDQAEVSIDTCCWKELFSYLLAEELLTLDDELCEWVEGNLNIYRTGEFKNDEFSIKLLMAALERYLNNEAQNLGDMTRQKELLVELGKRMVAFENEVAPLMDELTELQQRHTVADVVLNCSLDNIWNFQDDDFDTAVSTISGTSRTTISTTV